MNDALPSLPSRPSRDNIQSALDRLIAALKAGQPCDRFQSFTLYANGSAHALYDGAVFDFATTEHVEKLVALVEERVNHQDTKALAHGHQPETIQPSTV